MDEHFCDAIMKGAKKTMEEKQIKDFIEEEFGTKKFQKYRDWKGYEVYVPKQGKGMYCGLPYMVLVKDGEVRISTPDETIEWLNTEYSDEEELKYRYEN